MNSIKFITSAMRLLKPLSKLYNAAKTILPKSRKSENKELRAEIEALRSDLKKHENKICELSDKGIKKKEKATKKTEWIQAELYVATVEHGIAGSESAGYIMINLPNDEYRAIQKEFNEMPVSTIKKHLGIPQEKIIKNVSHGETVSKIEERFFEVNGKRMPLAELTK